MEQQPAAPSGDTPRRSRAPMQIVGERTTPDPTTTPLSSVLQQAATAATTPPSTEYVHRAAWKAGVLASINVLAIVLSVRLTLLVAVVGAIGLTIIALDRPDPFRLGAVAIYALVVVLPTIWLASR